MVSWSLLLEHAFALLLLWAWVGAAGLALLPCVRLHLGLVSTPLLGVIFWTLALYLFPFAGGLDLAAGLIILLLMIHCLLPKRSPEPDAQARENLIARISWSSAVLAIGSLAYASTLLFHHVPLGMDASMHTTAAALIAHRGGLPADYAPMIENVAFPPVNLGLPAVAAIAIRCGGEPAAVMLACQHLTFTCLILATYVLLRWWIPATSAAVIAVGSVWLARGTQATLGWGGFPTVLSVAVGVFAVRLLLQHARTPSWRLSLTTGGAIAAIPLIHGIGGGTWIYCAGSWSALTAVVTAVSYRATVGGLVLTVLCGATFLLVYRLAAPFEIDQRDMDETRTFVQQNAPAEEDWRAWLSALTYVRKDAGTVLILAGWGASFWLAVRQHWLAAAILAGAWLTLITVVANARWYVLPASFLLYPERVIYWAGPLSAVALALAWRDVPKNWQTSSVARATAMAVLILAAYFQNQFYQKIVREEGMSRDGWEALLWARDHLHPRKHFVQAEYNSIGSLLPAIAQIECTGSHHHHFIARQVQEAYARRICTHRFVERACAGQENLHGKLVFRNAAVTIVELSEKARTDQE